MVSYGGYIGFWRGVGGAGHEAGVMMGVTSTLFASGRNDGRSYEVQPAISTNIILNFI